jgi:3-keto-5-aminohexanoate cleavage enzyme
MKKKKIIVTVAPSSNFQGKEANPAIPEQPKEVAQSTYEAYNAGASIVHFHARDKEGIPTNDRNVIIETVQEIRNKCKDIIIQPSVAPANRPDKISTVDDGLNSLDVGAEMASLDCGIVVIPSAAPKLEGSERIIKWTRKWLVDTAKKMNELNIKPELEIFNDSQLEDAINYLIKPGLIIGKPTFTFVMNMKGSQGAVEWSMENLSHLIRKLPQDSMFGTMGVGSSQYYATLASLLYGGNVRVGFEDNIYYKKGELAKSNAQLVERIVHIAEDLGYEIATPDEAREMMGITKKL